MAITRASNSGITTGVLKYDSMLVGRLPLPSVPTIGTATAGDTTASVAFTAGPIAGTTYRALSTPGSIEGTGTTSPITVNGLTNDTSYTFQVRAENSTGNSAYSSASNSVTPTVPAAFESIATATGTGNSAIITFSSIPQTYKHLQIRFIGKSTTATSAASYTLGVEYNSGGTYTAHSLSTNGATITAASNNAEGNIQSRATVIPNSATALANQFGIGVIDILDYSTTNKYKTLRGFVGTDLNRTSTPTGAISLYSGMLLSTSALTTIKLTVPTGNWTTTSSFALYGIKD